MDIEKAKAKLEEYISIYEQLKCSIQPSEVKSIEVVLNELFKLQARTDRLTAELVKKDLIINEMGEQLVGLAIYDENKEYPEVYLDKNEVIEYFTKKVEGK